VFSCNPARAGLQLHTSRYGQLNFQSIIKFYLNLYKNQTMKKLFAILGSLVIIFSLFQCKKSETSQEKQLIVSYPQTGLWGVNILSLIDSTKLNSTDEYSFSAILQSDATLKVIITNLSVDKKSVWFYDDGSINGWSISDYGTTSNNQTFTSQKTGTLDLQMIFSGSSGSCKIEFYENKSTSPTKSRYLTW
jgi:hypothetical protein